MPEIYGPRSALGQAIHAMKYRAPEETFDDYCVRYARTTTGDDPKHFRRLLTYLRDQTIVPAGRQQLSVGRPFLATALNCFVMGTIPDDTRGIFAAVTDAAMTMRAGGGVGMDFSSIRPSGEPIRGLGLGALASGPVSFMNVWDAMCGTIMSAGSRRGAMMGTLRIDHPDILHFVKAKQNTTRLTNFNISVTVTDAFMEALANDGTYDLRFGDSVLGQARAVDVWAMVMENNWDFAEPGIQFIDRVNALNPLNYCETIHTSNPCVTADTWVSTSEGARPVAALIGKPFSAILDGKSFASTSCGFFKTGHKPVYRLRTKEGYSIRLTEDHQLQRVTLTPWRRDPEWIPARSFRPGDLVGLPDQRGVSWDGAHGANEGYLIGLLLGDGTLKQNVGVISVWRSAQAVGDGATCGADGIMAAATAAALTLPHRADFGGFFPVKGRHEHRLVLTSIRDLAHTFGMKQGHKVVTDEIESESSDFYSGFLRGFFDADGTVLGNQEKGVSVRLGQSNLDTLQRVQRMLLRLGIVSTIYERRQAARYNLLPDGRGGHAKYWSQERHELVISRANISTFEERVGFSDTDKAKRLRVACASYRRALNRERFVAEFVALEPDGTEDVFDCTIPEAHAFEANGLVAHNCSEQFLPPWGCCLLGSVNLVKLLQPIHEQHGVMLAAQSGKQVVRYEIDMEKLDDAVDASVRAYDAVIDRTVYPLEQQKQEEMAKRRMGIGVTGVANALEICGLPYASVGYVAAQDAILRRILNRSYRTSMELAKEKGPFPLWDAERYCAGEFFKSRLDVDLQDEIRRYGLRNGLLTSIAPTGTISQAADNVSSGIEPVFMLSGKRKVITPTGTQEFEVRDYAASFYGIEGRTADQVSAEEHVDVLCAAQHYVDNAISKTVNVNGQVGGQGPGVPFASFKNLYLRAWERGAKSCATFNLNGRRGSIFTADAPPMPAAEGAACFIDPETGAKACAD